jgi:hypothetical protein
MLWIRITLLLIRIHHSTNHSDANPDYYFYFICIRLFTLMRIRIQILAFK